MEGGREEANGEYATAGYQCGHWGCFTLLGPSKEPGWIHQNNPAEEGEKERLQYLLIGSRPSSGGFSPVSLEFWSLVGCSECRLRGLQCGHGS